MTRCTKLRRNWTHVLLHGFSFGFMPIVLAVVLVPWSIAEGSRFGLMWGLVFLAIASLALFGGGAVCEGQILTRSMLIRHSPVAVADVRRVVVRYQATRARAESAAAFFADDALSMAGRATTSISRSGAVRVGSVYVATRGVLSSTMTLHAQQLTRAVGRVVGPVQTVDLVFTGTNWLVAAG